MNEDLSTALMLLSVGMITVFLVLSFVVLVGNLLIIIVNKYVAEPLKTANIQRDVLSIPPQKIAAITAAVEVFTKGKGRITSVKRVEKP